MAEHNGFGTPNGGSSSSSGPTKYHAGDKVYAYEKNSMGMLYEAKVRAVIFC
jgi:hypothetical protein